MLSLVMSINCRVIFSSPRSNISAIRQAKESLAKLDDKAVLAAADSTLAKRPTDQAVILEPPLFHDIQLMQHFFCGWIVSSILNEEQAVMP
jgi:hypothetical protein